jgi:hypothetical protein
LPQYVSEVLRRDGLVRIAVHKAPRVEHSS